MQTQRSRTSDARWSVPDGALPAPDGAMPMTVDITFRGMDTSASIEALVREWTPRLELAFDRIQSCSVVFEHPHNSQRHGQAFHVRIELRVPERTIVVTRDPSLDLSHIDPRVAVADAFRAARRQLQDYARIRRGDIKQHVTLESGRGS